MIKFNSNDQYLNDGFNWAIAQASSYAHEEGEDLVGPWYESALPGRNAFCIRDICHQANGAHALGFEKQTKNMLLKFVQSISESRDFCCFWEIDKNYRPAPVDYTSDSDFWYNLPANFDLLVTCLRMYKLTGDKDYIFSEDFNHFYRLTVENYIQKWDTNGDGIPEAGEGRRGIPSYEEGEGHDAVQMLDLLASEARALYSYAEILKLQGKDGAKYSAMADRIVEEIDRRWDEKDQRYYFVKARNGELEHISHIASEFVLYFDVVSDDVKRSITLDKLNKRGEYDVNVETMSYFPEIFYMHDRPETGEYWLRRIISPELKRRTYPEVCFASIGAFVFGMLGIRYQLETKSITLTPKLPVGLNHISLTGLPVFGKTADITIEDGNVSVKYSV